MAYSISTWLNDVGSGIHGTTVNKIPNIYGIANRAARAVLLDVDPKETQRIVQLGQVFNSTYDYSCPVDVKGDRFVDIRPQGQRFPTDQYPQGYAVEFDAYKDVSFDNKIYTQWNTGVKTLRIEAPSLTAPLTLTDTSSITGWAATTGASNLALNTSNYVAGGGALSFDLLTGSSSGYVENSTLAAVNLANYKNVATMFLWVYIPTASATTDVKVRWGSSSADYWEATATAAQDGTAFQNGWNFLSFPWSGATSTGTPDETAVNYVRFTVDYSAAQTGFLVCNFTSTLGYYFQAQYYSKYLFRDPATNAFQETVADSTDNNKIINLDTDSYNLFFNKSMYFIAQALQGADAGYDATFWANEYATALKRYSALNPSEEMLKSATYYAWPDKGYSKYGGRWWLP